MQSNEGLGDFLNKTRMKLKSLAYPSSVAKGDSFPPRGKLKGVLPESSAKDCYLGNLPLRLAYSRELSRRSFQLTPTGGNSRACRPRT